MTKRSESRAARYWSALAAELSPYEPGEQPRDCGVVKLNTNENPYPPSPHVAAAIAGVDSDDLRRYPDPESSRLRETVAALRGLDPGQVFVGNGSDEVLSHVFAALLKQDEPLCFPDITYSFYTVWCQLHGIAFRQIPLDSALALDPAAFDAPCGGIVLANPNAPTGRVLAQGQLEAMLAAHPHRVVVVDEAYVDFGATSAVGLIGRHPNLLVVQTLSKGYALAGLRVGFAMGHRDLIEALGRVKNSFNSYPLGALAQAAAVAALQDTDYHARQCRRIIESREQLAGLLSGMGFDVIPSDANFLFVRHPSHSGRELYGGLRRAGFLVRHFDRPRIADYLRITIGTEEQCQGLAEALERLVQS